MPIYISEMSIAFIWWEMRRTITDALVLYFTRREHSLRVEKLMFSKELPIRWSLPLTLTPTQGTTFFVFYFVCLNIFFREKAHSEFPLKKTICHKGMRLSDLYHWALSGNCSAVHYNNMGMAAYGCLELP